MVGACWDPEVLAEALNIPITVKNESFSFEEEYFCDSTGFTALSGTEGRARAEKRSSVDVDRWGIFPAVLVLGVLILI